MHSQLFVVALVVSAVFVGWVIAFATLWKGWTEAGVRIQGEVQAELVPVEPAPAAVQPLRRNRFLPSLKM